MERTPIDTLTYEHLRYVHRLMHQSLEIQFLLFLGFQSLMSVTKRQRDCSVWVKRLRIGGQSDKGQR